MKQVVEQENTAKPYSRNVILLSGIICFASCLGWVLSGVIHEFGHALAVLSFGGIITELQPLVFSGAPHIAYSGSFTSVQRSIIFVAGASTTYWIGCITLMLFPFKRTAPGISLAVTFGFVPFLGQSLSYIFLPILNLLNVPVRDDVIRFLEFSQLNPILVLLSASVLGALALIILVKRCGVLSTIQVMTAQDKQ